MYYLFEIRWKMEQVHCKIYAKEKLKNNFDSVRIYNLIYEIRDNMKIFLKNQYLWLAS